MFARVIALGLVSTALLAGLTGCADDLATRTMHGEAAKAALLEVVNDSIESFKTRSGTEQILLENAQYGIIYDADAAAGKNIAFINLATPEAKATQGKEDFLFLFALPKMITDGPFTNGEFDYAREEFTVSNGVMNLTVRISRNLVNGTELTKTTAEGTMSQTTIENYGISDISKKQVAEATPAPTEAPAE
jgi:hypothetical protein